MYINTDVSNYLDERINEGFPPSSVRTREFTHNADDYRDSVVQYPALYSKFMLSEKMDTICGGHPELYHQSMLSSADEKIVHEIIQQYVPKAFTHYSLLGQLLKIPCDVVVCRRRDGGHFIDLAHLLFPNGWGADDAIGSNFNDFHEHVKRPNDNHVVPTAPKFVDFIIDSGKTYERVGAFNIKPSPEFNRHPSLNMSREFACDDTPAYIRFERQVIVSVPEHEMFLFFIHTNIVDFRANPTTIANAIRYAQPGCYSANILTQYGDYFLNYLEKYCNVEKNQNPATANSVG